MNIAIIGSGNVGGNLARAWTAKHRVVFGVREPSASAVPREVGVAEAAHGSEVIVLAVPYKAVAGVLAALGDVNNKIIIDCTNPLGEQLDAPSGAAVIARVAKGAHVVKAFNAQGAENIASPDYHGIAATVFYCGDDAAAKATARALIADCGFDPIDVGGLASAKLIESATLLWFAAAKSIGSRRLAFRLLREA